MHNSNHAGQGDQHKENDRQAENHGQNTLRE